VSRKKESTYLLQRSQARLTRVRSLLLREEDVVTGVSGVVGAAGRICEKAEVIWGAGWIGM